MIKFIVKLILRRFWVAMLKKYLLFTKKAIKKGWLGKALRVEDGISLIEMAIGLVVVGLVVTPVLQAYNVKIVQENHSGTEGVLSGVENAINQYYMSGNAHYPCPTNLFLGENDGDFGVSGDCTLANINLCTDVAWEAEGVCKTDDTTDAVIIGGVPFASLKMQQEAAIDSWGNKIIYAVTFEQTDVATFENNDGQIRVNAVDNPADVNAGLADGVPDELSNTIDFFLFSTGETGVGGYTKDGVSLTACGTAMDGYESENCNFDNRFFYDKDPDDAAASSYSLVSGNGFYDDLVRAQELVPVNTWFQHPDNLAYMDDFVLTASTRVGIGTANPGETIDVNGNLRAEGMVKAVGICNIDGAVCIDPELITGNKDQMKCDADDSMYGNQAVMRLANSRVSCNSTLNTVNSPIEGEGIAVDITVVKVEECDPGELISGIDVNGDIQCVIP